MEKSKTDIAAYKKQVFRHYVGTQAWEKYFLDITNKAMATTDWGMKVPPETHRETTTMWYGKKGMSFGAVAYEKPKECK